ncbi:hypothetical protein NR798_31940 [Archangium gephyra]|uniref:hypothetical protein n=1 Tax=Archangium gephyra TaxID=48 RepID=UPI0035D472CC
MRKLNPCGWVLGALLMGGSAMAAVRPMFPMEPVEMNPIEIGANTVGNAPITVRGSSVSGDTLWVRVMHGGGCRQHVYGLTWSGSFMESQPVQAHLQVTHNANQDFCRALLYRTLHFDLTPLKEMHREQYGGEHGSVILRIRGSNGIGQFVPYTF